jgi:voltage-gated potassium channel Kch
VETANKWHLGAGLAIAALGALSWLFGWNSGASAVAVLLSNAYLVSILIEASLRAQQERKVLNGVPQPKPHRFLKFPDQSWSLLQVQFLLVIVVFGFANLYVKSGETRYQGTATTLEQPDHRVADSSPIKTKPPTSAGRVDALYFSVVTLSTVGYGDFAPTSSKARLLVLWELGTGMLMLLGVFPLIVGRISDF